MDERTIQEEGLEAYGRFYSQYLGTVSDRKDPEKRGRLKLMVPQLWDDQVHEYWAEPKSMPFGKGYTVALIPKNGDKVWVTFQMGDQSYPVWDYAFDDSPNALEDIYGSDGEPDKILIKSFSGHTILMDDINNTLEIKHKDGSSLLMEQATVKLKHAGSDQYLELYATGMGLITDKFVFVGSKTATNSAVLSQEEMELWTDLVKLLTSLTVVPGTYTINPATLLQVQALALKIPKIASTQLLLDK